jgi:hypothetical protein
MRKRRAAGLHSSSTPSSFSASTQMRSSVHPILASFNLRTVHDGLSEARARWRIDYTVMRPFDRSRVRHFVAMKTTPDRFHTNMR